MLRGVWLWCAIAAVALPAHAVDVYRCTDANGRVEYRDLPCAGRSGAKVAIVPNVTSEIDQSAARAMSKAIADRNAIRLRDEQVARERAAKDQPVDIAPAQNGDVPWWQLPGPPPDRDKRPAPPDDTSPPPKPPKPSVGPLPAPVHPVRGR